MQLVRCFVYRKGTIFQANHNKYKEVMFKQQVVLYTAKVRFFKQITTRLIRRVIPTSCFVYRKGTIFQANHNYNEYKTARDIVVLYTAKVRFFKQITTYRVQDWSPADVVLYTAKVRFFKQITTVM